MAEMEVDGSPEVKDEPEVGTPLSTDLGEDEKVKRGRKRGVDFLDVIDPSELEGGRAAKRRASAQVNAALDLTKPSQSRTSPIEQTPENIKEAGMQLWQIISEFQLDGRLLSSVFMELPSRKQYPDYYEIIKKPIAMDEIKSKLEKGSYASTEEIKDDFTQMFTNAKRYNTPDSLIHEDAKRLQKLVRSQYQALTGITGPEEVDEDGKKKKKKPPTLKSWLNKKLEEVTFYQDSSGRYLSEIFMALPDRDLYPDYYEIIPQPMSFDVVQDKIKRKAYPNEKNFVKDVKGIFANAKYYNEERSQVWKDAAQLERVFMDVMKEPPPDFAALAAAGERTDNSEAPKLKLNIGGGQGGEGGPKLRIKMATTPTPAPELPPPPTPVKSAIEADVSMSPGTIAEVSRLTERQATAPRSAPAPLPTIAAPTAQLPPLLPPPGPRIFRERILAPMGGRPIVQSLIIRCRPTGPSTEIPMGEIRQHALVIPRAVETVEVVPVGQCSSRAAARPLLPITSAQDQSTPYPVFITRPPPAQILTTIEIFAHAGHAKEEVYRLFLHRLPV